MAPARVVETHVSVLFFLDDRVYKLRKPVRFGFLDFRDRATREADCHREVALNRRLAPDVYLGVADVQLEGQPVDHMFVMRRMPEERRLAALAARGEVLGGCIRQVARALVLFHATASRSPEISAAATGAALRSAWEANVAETDPFVGSVLDAPDETEIRSLVLGWLAGRAPLLARRIASGCVCDGHGDLQADDIFCVDDGVQILDCIEFSDRLRYCDVSADVAFLAMDLERLGRPEAAVQFLADYQEMAGDHFPDGLIHHYCASQAYIRAKVACLRAAKGADDAAPTARRLQSLALDHLRRARVRLVIVGGLPGSGKSTVAAGLSTARNWVVLRSDEIRQEPGASSGSPPLGFRQGRYSRAATSAVYGELLRRAELLLASGESVVLDASWIDAAMRDKARGTCRPDVERLPRVAL